MSPTSRRPGRLVLGHQLLVGLLAGPRVDRPRRDRRPGRGRSSARRPRWPRGPGPPGAPTGILKTKTSPPRAISAARIASSTARSVDITKRVIAGSVTVTGPPAAIWRKNSSSAEPRDPRTLPKRTLANRVGARPAVVRRRADELLGEELRGAHHGRRVGGLVGRGEDHRPDAGREAGVDHVLRPDDVRLGRLERVVLAGLDVLQRRAVEDDVDPVHRPVEPVAVADVADEEADVAPVVQPLALVELLRLVAAEDPDDRRVALQEPLDEPGADRAGAAGDEDARAAERGAGGDRRSSVWPDAGPRPGGRAGPCRARRVSGDRQGHRVRYRPVGRPRGPHPFLFRILSPP